MQPPSLSAAEEIVNWVTHGIGLLLSVVGAALLLGQASIHGDIWRLIGCGIYAATLITVYAASTLSHVVSEPLWRRRFRQLDQGSIYLLIVGTYTPFALEYLHSGRWWMLFCAMWIVAIGGFLSKLLYSHRIDAVAIWSYLLLAWIPIFPAPAYLPLVPVAALWWMLIGGLCYTAGTVFLMLDRRILHFHGIWHLFVIAGSSCHYWAVFRYVASAPNIT
jgi:hemolysin III